MTPYRKVLVAYDGSEGSRIAAIHAALLAKRLGAELRAIWVRGHLPHYPETIDEIDEEQETAREFFDRITSYLQSLGQEKGIEIQCEMRSGHPARTILEATTEHDADLIILGNRGHSRLWGGFLGHTADRVSEHAPCSVLIVRSAEEDAQFRRLLIGFDGSPGAEIALQHSFSLAKQLGSQVHVIWVHETHGRDSIPSQGSVERRFRHILPRINASAAAAGIEVRCVFKTGNPAKAIIAEAEAGRFRVVALGHRGSSGMWGRFLGGVADRVSEQAHCDVLIVREKRPD